MKLPLIIFMSVALFGSTTFVRAEMTSTNYRITADSVNCGGGQSTSTNYAVSDSLCETAPGEGLSSTNYALDSGFQANKDIASLAVTISPNSFTLASMGSGAVTSSDVVVTVTTNAGSGYATTIITDGTLRHTGGVEFTNTGAAENVTAGSGKYGIRTSGSHGLYNATDTGISTSLKTIASSSVAASAVATTITFKASPTATMRSGDYTQTITLITTGTF